MAAVLALSAAIAYGVGDFLGGVAARREPAAAVVLWSHVVGLAALLALAPLAAGDPTPRALAVGGVAGLLGGVGVALFYRALSLGTMSVVAPIAALLSAAVPVLVGLATGERPGVAAVLGIAVALVAIVLVSRDVSVGDDADRFGSGRKRSLRGDQGGRALLLALAAGLAFGLFFVVVGQAGDDTGIWPLVAARVASVSLFAALGAARLTAASPPRAAVGAAVGCGVLDASANVLYVLALSHGLLSIVAVLTALYPAGTVVLARVVLGERLARVQRAGLAFAGLAAVLIVA